MKSEILTVDWQRQKLKDMLGDLLERADEIIDTMVDNYGTDMQIRIDIKSADIPTYTIETTYFSKKLFENGKNDENGRE